MRGVECLPSHSRPSETAFSHQQPSLKEASHPSTGGLSLETVSTPFLHPASDAILQWDHSRSFLKAATAPQALDPTPSQVNKSTMPQVEAVGHRSERSFERLGRRSTDFSHAGRTRKGRAISKERERLWTRPLSETKDMNAAMLSKTDSVLSRAAGLPRSTTNRYRPGQTGDTQFPLNPPATESDHQTHHVPSTHPALKIFGACTVIAANTPPTAEDKATTAHAKCQPQSAQCPQNLTFIRRHRASRSRWSLASNDNSTQTLPMASTSPKQLPTGQQYTSRSTFDTRPEQARRCRRTSAPAVLMSLDTDMGADPATAIEVGKEPLKTTSASSPRQGMRADRVESHGHSLCHLNMIESSDSLKTSQRARPCHHLRLSCHQKKDIDIEAPPIRQFDQQEGTDPLTAYCNQSEVGTPTTSEPDFSSDVDSNAHDTPLTSPCTSPIKVPSKQRPIGPPKDSLAQLDGTEEQVEKAINARLARDEEDRLHWHKTRSEARDKRPSVDDTSRIGIRTPSHDRSCLDLPGQLSEHEAYVTALEAQESDDEGDDEETPLVTPSPAKGAKAFPFPNQKETLSLSKRTLSRLRHPSALLKHCEGLATPRQRQLMRDGARTPDRFVPLRAATPTKESLFLSKPVPKLAISRRETGRRSPPADPFGPAPRRSLRMAEQFATIRTPPPAPRQVGLRTSLVPNAESPTRRSASAGAVWSVSGTTTTEGVASFTNGRGGRVTSGTSAPHYAADFLRRNTPSQEEATHGRRLALAMDIDQGARMLDHSLTPSPSTSSPRSGSDRKGERVWRNGGWERQTSPLTRTS